MPLPGFAFIRLVTCRDLLQRLGDANRFIQAQVGPAQRIADTIGFSHQAGVLYPANSHRQFVD